MNLSDFSLLMEDSDSYSIGHPQGKSIRVPKNGLSEKAHVIIQKLKKEQGLAEGGQVKKEGDQEKTLGEMIGYPGSKKKSKGYSEGGGVTRGDPEWLQDMQAVGDRSASEARADYLPEEPVIPEQTVSAPIPEQQMGIPASAEMVQPAGVAPPVDPSVQEEVPGVPNQGAALTKAAGSLAGGVAAESAEGKANAKVYGDLEAQMAANSKAQATYHNEFKVKDAELMNQMQQGKIDPDRYLHSMGTGSRIVSAISMILGGIGAGLTGGPNLAAKQLDDAINRDMEAQRNDQSKNMNLWKMNREAYSSDLEANLATQNQMLNGAKYKVMANAERIKGPLAMQRAAMLTADIEQKMETNRAMLSGMRANSVGSLEFLPEEKRERAVPLPQGGYAFAPTKEDAKAAKASIITLTGISKQIESIEKFMGGEGTTIPGSAKSAQANAMQSSLTVALKDLYELGAISGSDLTLLNKMVPNPGQFMQSQGKAQLRELKKTIQNKMESVVSTRLPGAKVPGGGGLSKPSQRQQAIIAYAKAHPEDPKSAIHLKKLGVE